MGAVLFLGAAVSPAVAGPAASSPAAAEPGDGPSFSPALSGDGRFVAFASRASNLVPGDTNGAEDVFVFDRSTGLVSRVSVGPGRAEGDGASFGPAISADGRYVAFESEATNLVAGDDAGHLDVFLHDRQTGATELVSATAGGKPAGGPSFAPALSADGQFVAFGSAAPDLVPGDRNAVEDIFVRDASAGLTTRVSMSSSAAEGDGRSFGAAISSDGTTVAFASFAANLAPGAKGKIAAVFVHDGGATELVSPKGADGASFGPTLSGDGSLVAYSSFATKVVDGDTNDAIDAFVYDRTRGATARVSVASDGTQADGLTFSPRINAGGTVVAFKSEADSLVEGDDNSADDVFVHDLSSRETILVSVAPDGGEANGASVGPALDDDGDTVAFSSVATNLTPGDDNGFGDVFVRSDGETTAASRPAAQPAAQRRLP